MDSMQYKSWRDKRIKQLYKTEPVERIAKWFTIEESLVRKIVGEEPKVLSKYSHKSLDVADPKWD